MTGAALYHLLYVDEPPLAGGIEEAFWNERAAELVATIEAPWRRGVTAYFDAVSKVELAGALDDGDFESFREKYKRAADARGALHALLETP